MRSGCGEDKTSASFQSTRPRVGRVTVARIRISVDFPAPLGPSSPRTPGRNCRLMFCSPQTFPRYCFPTESIRRFIGAEPPRERTPDLSKQQYEPVGEKVSTERVSRGRECALRAGKNPENASDEKLLVPNGAEGKRARRVETNDNRTVGQGADFGKSASNSGSIVSRPQYIGRAAYNTG